LTLNLKDFSSLPRRFIRARNAIAYPSSSPRTDDFGLGSCLKIASGRVTSKYRDTDHTRTLDNGNPTFF